MANWDVTTANSFLLFEGSSNGWNSSFMIDTDHAICFWSAAPDDGFVQVFTINTTTWAVTTAAASLEFDTQAAYYQSCAKIDANHFINFWSGPASDGFAQVFTVNTTTWAVTTAAASLEFDTDNNLDNSCVQIDDNHFINFWAGTGTDGFTQVFTVNTTTWAISTTAAKLEFDVDNNADNFCFKVDTNHVVNIWRGATVTTDSLAQVFTINTTTWAVTTAAARLVFDTDIGADYTASMIDANHFICFWSGIAADGYAQVFTINTTTWEITTAATSLEFDVDSGEWNDCVKIDTNHFINFWSGQNTSDGFVQVFEVNTTTWTVTTAAASLEFDTQNNYNNSAIQIDPSHYLNFWLGNDATDGRVQVFTVTLPPTTTIKTVDGVTRANVKTYLGVASANIKTINGIS